MDALDYDHCMFHLGNMIEFQLRWMKNTTKENMTFEIKILKMEL